MSSEDTTVISLDFCLPFVCMCVGGGAEKYLGMYVFTWAPLTCLWRSEDNLSSQLSPAMWFWDLNSGLQAWQKVPFPGGKDSPFVSF